MKTLQLSTLNLFIEKEKVKLQNKVDQQKNIVAAVSNPQTIVNRCKLIGMDADQIRNTIIQCGPDLWINERDTKDAIIKHLAGAVEEINEIQKFLDTIKPEGNKDKKKNSRQKKGKIDIAVAILHHPKSNPPRCSAGGIFLL